MAIRTNTAEGGVNGSTATIANSGGASGTAFDSVTGGVTYSTLAAQSGALGYRTAGSTAIQFCQWSVADTQINLQADFMWDATPVSTTFLRITAAAGAVAMNVLTSGAIQVFQSSSRATSTAILVAGVAYRMTLWVDTVAAQGRAACVRKSDSAVIWESAVFPITLATPASAAIGKYDSVAAAVNWDNVVARSGSDGAYSLAPPGTPLATPVVTVTSQVNPTTLGGADGSITVSWPAIAGAVRYEASIMPGTITSGFTASDSAAVSPKTFSGLTAGPYTLAIKAKVT